MMSDFLSQLVLCDGKYVDVLQMSSTVHSHVFTSFQHIHHVAGTQSLHTSSDVRRLLSSSFFG